jgi:hypothetical protein
MKIELRRVRFMPQLLDPGLLYVSEEFEIAIHLCACGCGTKIKTPLGPADWSLEETKRGVSLRPSIGNWQETCRSHYWIRRGRVIWAKKLTSQQVDVASRSGVTRREARHIDEEQPVSFLRRAWQVILERWRR